MRMVSTVGDREPVQLDDVRANMRKSELTNLIDVVQDVLTAAGALLWDIRRCAGGDVAGYEAKVREVRRVLERADYFADLAAEVCECAVQDAHDRHEQVVVECPYCMQEVDDAVNEAEAAVRGPRVQLAGCPASVDGGPCPCEDEEDY
jgi:hypothetical protein